MLVMMQGDRQAAQRYYAESLALAQQIDNRLGEALLYDQRGLLYLAEDQIEQSKEVIQQGLTIFQELGVDVGSAHALCHLGQVAIAQADFQAAQHYYLRTIQIAQRVQAPPLLIESAAGALHLCLHTRGHDGGAAATQELLWSLRQHPACTAETKHYITALLRDEQQLAAEHTRNGNLEHVLATVTAWLTRTFQPQIWSIQRAL